MIKTKDILKLKVEKKLIILAYGDDSDYNHGWICFYHCDLKYDKESNQYYHTDTIPLSKELNFDNVIYIQVRKNTSNIQFELLIKKLLDHFNHIVYYFLNFTEAHLVIINNEMKKRFCTDKNNIATNKIDNFPGRFSEYFIQEKFSIQYRFLKASDLFAIKQNFLNYTLIDFPEDRFKEYLHNENLEKKLKSSYIKTMQFDLINDPSCSYIIDSPLSLKDLIRVQHFDNATLDEIRSKFFNSLDLCKGKEI